MKKIAIILCALFLAVHISAEVLKPVKWSYDVKYNTDNEAVLIFKADIEKHWHIYDLKIEGDGPVPTTIIIAKNSNFTLKSAVVPITKAVVKYDSSFMIKVGSYDKKAIFQAPIKIHATKDFKITGTVEYMTCNDGMCLPPELIDFAIDIKGAKIPAIKDSVSMGTVAQISDSTTKTSATSSPIVAEIKKDNKPEKSLWFLFWLSFVAGLLAILTPCVFPMIPMTVSFFMKASKNKVMGRINALVYGFSIVFIYVVIGTLVAVTLGANFANFLSTHWLPNILFFLIFTFFAASFLGMFEIVLPSSWVNSADKQVDRGGLMGSFFMAFTLVLVSFSCTGPLVGAILVQSAGGAIIEPIIGMLGFSLAFAFPFTLFAFFPQWLNGLPKSGGWLNSVKVVLGFIELALGLKFLSIADQTYHWGILDREIYLAFWIVIFTLLGFYLLGKLKFSHDSDMKSISVPRLMLAIITFTFVVYLFPGMFGAPLKAISGYLPPATSQDFDMNAIMREKNAQPNQLSEFGETPKFADFLHLPHGIKGFFDYQQALAYSKKVNKPIFIDFTGHGCVNCREMEASVWADPRVLKILNEDYVVLALYVDDKTELPQTEWVKSKYDGETKKTIGKINADFQIERYNVNAQPYYVLLNADEKNLATPKAYDKDVEKFVKFLEDGKKAFLN